MTDVPVIKDDNGFNMLVWDVCRSLSSLAPSTENTETLKKIAALQLYAAVEGGDRQIKVALCVDRAYHNAMEVIRITEFNLHIKDKLEAARRLVNRFEERQKEADE